MKWGNHWGIQEFAKYRFHQKKNGQVAFAICSTRPSRRHLTPPMVRPPHAALPLLRHMRCVHSFTIAFVTGELMDITLQATVTQTRRDGRIYAPIGGAASSGKLCAPNRDQVGCAEIGSYLSRRNVLVYDCFGAPPQAGDRCRRITLYQETLTGICATSSFGGALRPPTPEK